MSSRLGRRAALADADVEVPCPMLVPRRTIVADCPARYNVTEPETESKGTRMTYTQQDGTYMREALALARQGQGFVEPNPMVGAVVVRNGEAVGRGYHKRFGGPHAEAFALREAGEAASGATMYVTLEPCAREGKTPPCAPQVVDAGVSRVVIAAMDPTPQNAGKGAEILRQAGVQVETGLCREDAIVLNAPFYKVHSEGLPLVTAKWAMSVDGKIATRSHDSRWISCDESRTAVHELRGRMDAIVVGGHTALRDDPLLTCRDGEKRRTAARVVLCGGERLDASSRLARTAGEAPVLLAHVEGSPPGGLDELVEAGCEALPLPPVDDELQVDPRALLEALAERDAVNVLVEGGGHVLGSFSDAGLLDRVMVFLAPLVIGGAQAVSPVAGRGVESMDDALCLERVATEQSGRDVLMTGWVHDPMKWAP